MKRQNVRSLLLVAGMLIYLFIGAAIFESLESTNEERERGKLERERLELMKKYNLTSSDWNLLADHIVRFIPHKAGLQWKFAGAMYFSTTVITTIGYGHCTPKTNWGKIVCMVYALIGIPLNLVTFQSIGERLNTFTTFLLCNVRRRLKPYIDITNNNTEVKASRKSNETDTKKKSYEFYSHLQKNNRPHEGYPASTFHYSQLNNNPGFTTSLSNGDDIPNVDAGNTQVLCNQLKNVRISPKKKDEWSFNDFLSSSFSSKGEETTDTHLICVTTSISTVFVAGGAYAFSRYEGWSYLDSLYFCIITLTTVGFGDLVALQKERVLQDRPGYVTFNIFFILSGLAVVSAAMNLLVLRFLTMNTEDEKRDKILESFTAEAKLTTSVLPRWLINSESKRKNFLSDLFNQFKRRFVKPKSHSPLLKPPRYRVTRAPTENVHHLIDSRPSFTAFSPESRYVMEKIKNGSKACLCRTKLLNKPKLDLFTKS